MALAYRAFPLAPDADPGRFRRFGTEEDLRRYVAASLERVRAQPGGDRIRPEAVASAPFAFPYSMPALCAVKAAGWVGGPAAAVAYFDRAAAAWFEEARNVADEQVLIELAVEVGLDRAAFAEAFADPARRAEVELDRQEAHRLGVTAVPTVLLPGGTAIVGAQPEDVFRDAFARLTERGGTTWT